MYAFVYAFIQFPNLQLKIFIIKKQRRYSFCRQMAAGSSLVRPECGQSPRPDHLPSARGQPPLLSSLGLSLVSFLFNSLHFFLVYSLLSFMWFSLIFFLLHSAFVTFFLSSFLTFFLIAFLLVCLFFLYFLSYLLSLISFLLLT